MLALVPKLALLPDLELEILIQQFAAKWGKVFAAKEVRAEIRKERRAQRVPGSSAGLIVSDNGAVKPVLANAITTLRQSGEWEGVLGYDEFALRVAGLKKAPWGAIAPRWGDHEDRLATDWLQHKGVFVGVDVAGQAVQVVAQDRRFHPVKDYLEGIEWDGVKRLDTWTKVYLGVPRSNYSQAVGPRWLISAVARIYQPGCMAKYCLILEGVQDLKKSTALSVLGGHWFTDDISELGSKDSKMETHGVWIIEIGELSSMRRGDVDRVKAFIARKEEHFRPPYGKHVIDAPRQCVFAGSTNKQDYLTDETGGVRWWPVECGHIDIPLLTCDRDQIWAEARDRYKAKCAWWLDTEALTHAATLEQADRYEGDAWDEEIGEWVDGRPDVSVAQVLSMCLVKKKEHWTQQDKNRVARSLRAINWERFRASGGLREYRYRPRGLPPGRLV